MSFGTLKVVVSSFVSDKLVYRKLEAQSAHIGKSGLKAAGDDASALMQGGASHGPGKNGRRERTTRSLACRPFGGQLRFLGRCTREEAPCLIFASPQSQS